MSDFLTPSQCYERDVRLYGLETAIDMAALRQRIAQRNNLESPVPVLAESPCHRRSTDTERQRLSTDEGGEARESITAIVKPIQNLAAGDSVNLALTDATPPAESSTNDKRQGGVNVKSLDSYL